MGKILLICICFLGIMACNSPANTSALNRSDSIRTIKVDTKKEDTLKVDTTGFLSNCKALTGMSEGALQGTNYSKDSTNYLGFAACYTCPKTYEMIFAHKGGVESRRSLGYDGVEAAFDKGCDNTFSEFDCYAFVAPMRDPDKQKDISAMNIDFPVTVKAYERIENDNWHLVKVLKVKTFEEYAAFQFKTIYSLK